MGFTLFIISVSYFVFVAALTDFSHPSPEFSRFNVVQPTVQHLRSKREINHTRERQGSLRHLNDVSVKLKLDGEERILDLQLNRDLIPKNHMIRHQRNGTHVVHRPTADEIELCHYYGNIRGVPGSWAAISTCNGIRGMIHDGKRPHYIEKSPSNPGDVRGDHFVYDHNDILTNHTCGFDGTPHDVLESIERVNVVKRSKRSPQSIRGPYNADKRSRFVELVLVVDYRLYEGMHKNLEAVNNHCKDIANIINALFVPLNIFIALVGVVVWAEYDEIGLSTKGDTTLTSFLHYRRETLVKQQANDNAQLLTRVQFEGGVVGKALKGPICTYEFSGGVSMDHSPVVGLVATTVAHEMGHNFGMEHDTPSCECPDDRCIMAASSSSTRPTHWSSCSLSYLASAFEHGMDYCLRNKPEKLFDSPVCGNGFVEPGEQCDCGLKDRCNNPCCNASTCMLYSNASCATGECCDLTTCHPKTAGSMCRTADHECDLPEYCTGESEYCPNDVFKMDGETCYEGKAFCYKGTCRSHTDQCKLLWGPSGKSSDMKCYFMNTKGSRHGNCGYNRLNQSYIKCYDEHVYCGMLHCMHLSEKLEFGMESVAILSHSFINKQGSVIPCRTAIVDLGLNEVDPGLAPDGAKCAEGKMCVGQRCLPVGSLMVDSKCRNNCNGNGVCNSLGHCHCNTGFAPPECHNPGTGGSEDSGPASQPNARREVITAFYIVFLGIVPAIALVSFFIYYVKRQPIFRRKPRASAIHEKKTHHGGGSGGIRGPPPPISGPLNLDHSLLLPHRNEDAASQDLHNNLLGQFVGFSITPIQHPPSKTQHDSPKVVPIRPAPKAPLPQETRWSAEPQKHSVQHFPQQTADVSRPISEIPTQGSSSDGALLPSRPAPTLPSVTFAHPPPAVHNDKKNVPTLTRIASFMKGQKLDKSDKRAKFDKETLRGLEISGPIPQTPSATVENQPPAEKVQRVQSMREAPVAKRPQLPSFGSMRVGNANNKRPASIPAAVRPTSPPPRPPSTVLNHEYDDCLVKDSPNPGLNFDDRIRTGDTVAPLALIDEESPRENIYAVIEENPVIETKVISPQTERRGVKGDTLGLLSEIVSEIEARNNESIYSASTLKRKKDKEKEDSGSTAATDKSSDTYINTSWKSDSTQLSSTSSNSSNSGYLSPINGINQAQPEIQKPAATQKAVPAIPDAAAPYKPYSSSLVRSSGPYLASANSKPETPKLDAKAPMKRTKTPPSLAVNKKTPSLAVAAPKVVRAPPNGKPSVKPDLVSSCEASQGPDVITKSGPPLGVVKPPVAKRKPSVPGAKGGSKVASLQAKFESGKKDTSEKVTINR